MKYPWSNRYHYPDKNTTLVKMGSEMHCLTQCNASRTDLWLMRQGEQTLFEFYAALEKQVALCKFTNPHKILSTAFIMGLKDRATITELIVKAGDKPDELPPDQCLKIASAMQCAVSAP